MKFLSVRSIFAGLLLIAVTVLASHASWADAPANDNFAAAQTLSGASGTTSGTTTGSTVETGEPYAYWGNSVWYRYVTGPSGGTLAVSPTNSTGYIYATIYTGTAVNSLTPVPSNPANGDTENSGPVATTANTQYDIQVWSSYPAEFSLSWACSPPPPNDNFTNLKGLTGVSGTLVGTTIGATRQAHEPAQYPFDYYPYPQGGSVWYRTTLPRGKTLLTATGNVGIITYTGTSFAGLQRSSDYTQISANSCVFATAYGTTTYIQITGETAFGDNFSLSYNFAPAPPNDLVAKAIVLAPAGGELSGTTVGAGSDPLGPVETNPAYGSVWYQLTPGMSTVSLTASGNLRIAVYTGRNQVSIIGSSFRFSAAAGADYLIQVCDDSETLGTNFHLAWRVDPVPPNDNFSNATAISSPTGARHGTTSGATVEGFGSSYGVSNDVWYEFTPSIASGGVLQFQLAGPSINAASAFSGSTLDTLVPVVGGGPGQSFSLPTLAGSPIYIEVATGSVSGAPFTLSWLWSPNPPNPPIPANDLFANAQAVTGPTGTAVGTTLGASLEVNELNLGAGSVWYRYTPPTTGPGRAVFTLSNYSGSNSVITAYSGYALSQLAPEDSGTTTASIQTSPGAPVFVQVCSANIFGTNTASPFTLGWTWTGAPANDNFANAQLLSGASGTAPGTTAGSSAEFNEPSSFFFLDSSVWYRYVTPATGGTLGFTVSGYAGGASGITVYSGSSLNALNRVANGTATASLSTTPSTTYWVQVQGQGPDVLSTSNFNLGWSLTGSTTSKSSRSSASSAANAATTPSGHSS